MAREGAGAVACQAPDMCGAVGPCAGACGGFIVVGADHRVHPDTVEADGSVTPAMTGHEDGLISLRAAEAAPTSNPIAICWVTKVRSSASPMLPPHSSMNSRADKEGF